MTDRPSTLAPTPASSAARPWPCAVGRRRLLVQATLMLGLTGVGPAWMGASAQTAATAPSTPAVRPDLDGLFDRLAALSQQRYGRGASQTVRDWARLVQEGARLSDGERLTLANAFFNRRVPFEEDLIVWRLDDYWATPLEFTGVGLGDCEDYVIAKYKTLQLMGVARDRLRFIYVRASIGVAPPVAHMVLGYYAEPGGEPLILDNLIGVVRPASQRPDLAPVYSFNAEGLWVGNAARSAADPTVRLSKWRDLLQRLRDDGLP